MDQEPLYFVRPAKKQQVPFYIELTNGERWNTGIFDYQLAFTFDPEALLLGFLKRQSSSVQEEPISTIVAFKNKEDFGHIGAYIVKPEHRGKKYGITIFNEAMKRFKNTKTVGLDSVLIHVGQYERSGFRGAYKVATYHTTATGKNIEHPNIIGLNQVPFQELNDYDKTIFPGGDRSEFLQIWVKFFSDSTLIYKSGGKIQGYGVLRKNQQKGYNIGPFYADSNDIASSLLESFRGRVDQGQYINVNTPEAQTVWVQEQKLEKQVEFLRMYTNGSPEPHLQKIFSVLLDFG